MAPPPPGDWRVITYTAVRDGRVVTERRRIPVRPHRPGTWSGVMAHRRAGEPQCGECATFRGRDRNARRAAQ